MWFKIIPSKRNAKAICIPFYCDDHRHFPQNLIQALGFQGVDDTVIPVHLITIDQARDMLVNLVWKDLAFLTTELMTQDEAKAIANSFFRDHPADTFSFYTNGNWVPGYNHSSNPLTKAAFDGGIIALGNKICSAIWFEEEEH